MHLYHGRYTRETNDFGKWFTKEMPYKKCAGKKRQFRITYIMGRYIRETKDFGTWFTKEMPYKIFAFTKSQFRCTFIMSAKWVKIATLWIIWIHFIMEKSYKNVFPRKGQCANIIFDNLETFVLFWRICSYLHLSDIRLVHWMHQISVKSSNFCLVALFMHCCNPYYF